MDKNLYLDILQKGLGGPGSQSVESIEGLLGHIADLHNTMGKSYEYLVDVISSLIKASENKKQTESVQKKNKELEREIELLRNKLYEFEDEIKKAKERTFQMELDSRKKDDLIIDLQKKLDLANEKMTFPVQSQKDLAFIRSFHTQKDPPMIEEEPRSKKKLEDLLTPTPTEEITTLKRKYDELMPPLPPSHQILDFEDDGEKSSTTTNNKDNSNEGDDYKFKKVFKKVKRNENNKNANSTSTPFVSLAGLTVGGRKSDFTMNRTSQMGFDEHGGSLENLLGNFVEARDPKDSNSKSLTNKIGKNSDSNKSLEKERSKEREREKEMEREREREKEKEKEREKERERLFLKKDNGSKDYLDIQDTSKVYKKGVGLAFSQQSPLKSLELTDSDKLGISIPITRNGRTKAETNSNIMQRMMMGNKKRNSAEPIHAFKLSAKKDEDKKPLPVINDEDLIRTSHRSKLEREGLQGFDCDQFL